MEKQNKKQILSPMFWVFASLSIIILLIYWINPQGSEARQFFALPLGFVIGISFIYYKNPNANGLGFSLIVLIMFMRYVVTTVILLRTSSLNNASLHNYTLPLMLYEMAVVYLILRMFSINNPVPNYRLIAVQKNERVITKILFRIILLAMLIGMLLFPSMRSSLFNFSFSDEGGVMTEEVGGIFYVAFKIGLVLVYSYAVRFIIRKARSRTIGFWLTIMVSALYISSTWTGGGNISRWSLLTSMLMVYVVLRKTFPERQKLVITLGSLAGIGVVLLTSITTLFLHHGASGMEAVLELFSGEYLNAYFQGPPSVSNGLMAMDAYASEVGFVTLLDDTISAYPVINSLFYQPGNLTQLFYQNYIGRIDKILATVAQGYAHFGIIGAPLFSGILAYIALICDRKMKQSENIVEVVALGLISTYSALFMAINVFIIQRLTMYYVLVLFVLWIGKHFKVGRKTL